jgi:hypothetical protein
MRRLPTMLASASAAALSTLAITVAVPAIADNGGGAGGADEFQTCLRDHGLRGAPDGPGLKPWLGARLEHGDAGAKRATAACAAPKPTIVKTDEPSEQDLRSCLTQHGAAVPAGDGRVLKNWILEHGDDAANRSAMKACHFVPPDKATVAGPCSAKAPSAPGPAGKPATAD